MSATEPTLPPQAAPRNIDEEQRALATALAKHPDPHVRLLAHISERQMAFVEILTEVRNGQQAVVDSIESLTTELKRLSDRQDAIEDRYPTNGSAHVG